MTERAIPADDDTTAPSGRTITPRHQVADPLLHPDEVAEILGISADRVRELARDRKLPAIRLGRYWRFRESSLREWIESQERPAR